ncbi:BCCT family transporter [Arthrobacter castelli]|uniref:BCCT family transporter n=1 Tax=Arthrobacter castelli TaxID=271431 RepID=UPI000684B995|nr:BCCT family transporter [Arthrobacter castelli]
MNAPASGSDARGRLGPVFYASLLLSVVFVAFGLIFPRGLTESLAAIREVVVGTFGPVYPVAVSLLLLFVVVLALVPVGRKRLGGPDAKPEFGAISWVAMLMSAGVGLSFLFWGVAEPLIHLADPPYGATDPGSAEAARAGMRYSFLFWGPHAWGIYAVVAIAIGYASFNRGSGMLVSAALRPLFGRLVDGWVGNFIDTLTVLAMLFGIATSLGLGTGELSAGLASRFGIADSYGVKIAIVVGLMTFATISAMTGLGRGIRVLSLVNAVLCGVLLVYVFVAGPTESIMSTLGTGVADYAAAFVPMGLATEGAAGDAWTGEWVYFFWAWWIAWAPFVGTFIARISRGRTIRGVVTGVVLVPSLVSVVWFSVFGGTSLQRELSGAVSVSDTAGEAKSIATLAVFDTLPLTGLALVLLVPVLALLFITSADSASFMLGSTTTGGSMKPPRPMRLMWSFAAAFAAVLLLSGGRDSLRGAAVIAAAPFTLILLGMVLSLFIMLWRDRAVPGRRDTS